MELEEWQISQLEKIAENLGRELTAEDLIQVEFDYGTQTTTVCQGALLDEISAKNIARNLSRSNG
jgi:hypothetical protein